MREHVQWINDRDTLEEMLTFVRSETGKPEAQEGAHDDCVMSLAIAYYSREQMHAAEYTQQRWTKDMYEDYKRASPGGKEMLRKRWGTPGGVIYDG